MMKYGIRHSKTIKGGKNVPLTFAREKAKLSDYKINTHNVSYFYSRTYKIG